MSVSTFYEPLPYRATIPIAATLPAKRGQEHPLVKLLLQRQVDRLREDFYTQLKEVWKGMAERDRKQVDKKWTCRLVRT
jgi:hypothetical protein